jgi:hypothetical protein
MADGPFTFKSNADELGKALKRKAKELLTKMQRSLFMGMELYRGRIITSQMSAHKPSKRGSKSKRLKYQSMTHPTVGVYVQTGHLRREWKTYQKNKGSTEYIVGIGASQKAYYGEILQSPGKWKYLYIYEDFKDYGFDFLMRNFKTGMAAA